MRCPKCGVYIKVGRPNKLTPDVIKTLASEGWSVADIAKYYHVSRPTVYAALKKRV